MFAKPDPVRLDRRWDEDAVVVSHGCPSCTMRAITLVLTNDRGDGAEYDLFCCSRLPKTYLADLYALYAGRRSAPATLVPERVETVTALQVAEGDEEILEPGLWLDCVAWSRYAPTTPTASLEVYVARPKNSRLYHAVGNGNLLIGADDEKEEECPQHAVRIHASTREMLCGLSKTYCINPKIVWVNRK